MLRKRIVSEGIFDILNKLDHDMDFSLFRFLVMFNHFILSHQKSWNLN